MTSRRRVLATVVVAGVLPLRVAQSQQVGTRRIGILFPGKSDIVRPLVAAIRDGLKDLGWIEGRNLISDLRVAEADFSRVDALAAELVALKPDVLVAATILEVRAFQRLAPKLPLIFCIVADPVGSGLVKSLARPGGNMTGLSTISNELMPKRMQLLRDFLPQGARIAALVNPGTEQGFFEELRRTASRVGLELEILTAKNVSDIAPTLARIAREKFAGLMVMDGLVNTAQRREIAAAIGLARIPAVYVSDLWTDTGALMSYGINYVAHYRRIATFVDKILKGAKPADLPVEQPTTFELIVNLKTAREQGIKVPASVLVRADRVIE